MPLTVDRLRSAQSASMTSGSGLELTLSARFKSRAFEEFFPAYDKAFILPAEKEEASGFEACFDLNYGEAHRQLVARYGDFIEFVLVARDPVRNLFVGGANLIVMSFPGVGGQPVVTSNLNYIFTAAEARGRGYFRKLLAAIAEVADGLFPLPAGQRPLMFIEQNDPFKMDPEAYEADTAYAGIDQFDRLLVWAKAGARILDFPYVQPGLSALQPADETLAYAALSPGKDSVEAAILAEHLKRFFAISVFKGDSIEHDPTITKQLAALTAPKYKTGVKLIDPTSFLIDVTATDDRWSKWNIRPQSLVEALSS